MYIITESDRKWRKMTRLYYSRNLNLEDLLVFPALPSDFARRWEMRLYGSDPGVRTGSRLVAQRLSEYTGLSLGTWTSRLSSPSRNTLMTGAYLRSLDILWQLQGLVEIPLDKIIP